VKERLHVSSGSPFEPEIGFSRAVVVGRQVHVSGTAPIAPDGGSVAPDAYDQARRCLEIVLAALREAGGGLEHVVRTRTYLVDASDWREVGRAHGEVFGEIRPASTMVVVAALLDPAWKVEIEVDAILD
jgi:enamine deaminase RidA (YjgF/YER057c/UK114 family)